MLSLESIAANKIIGLITASVMYKKEFSTASDAIGEIQKELSTLNIQHTLGETLKEVVEKICHKIEVFSLYLSMFRIDFSLKFVSRLYFTTTGDIGYKLSICQLVRDKSWDTKYRITLSCMFCFEEEILDFWKSNRDLFRELRKHNELATLCSWVECLEGMTEPSIQFLWENCFDLMEGAFIEAVGYSILDAAGYFYKKMEGMPIEQRMSILHKAKNVLERGSFPNPFNSLPSFRRTIHCFLIKCMVKEFKLFFHCLSLKENLLGLKYDMSDKKFVVHKNQQMLWDEKEENITRLKGEYSPKNSDVTEQLNNDFVKLVNLQVMLKNELVVLRNEREMLDNERLVLNKEKQLWTNRLIIIENWVKELKNI